MVPSPTNTTLARAAGSCLVLLAAACLAWEMAVAPLRPGGSWVALKALPAIAPIAGVLQERRYTFQWASMLALAYVAEGLVRSVADQGASRAMALVELAFSLAFFALAIVYLKRNQPGPRFTPAD